MERGLAWPWRRWCLHAGYLLCENAHWRGAFDRVAAPIPGYSFEDDPIIQSREAPRNPTLARLREKAAA